MSKCVAAGVEIMAASTHRLERTSFRFVVVLMRGKRSRTEAQASLVGIAYQGHLGFG